MAFNEKNIKYGVVLIIVGGMIALSILAIMMNLSPPSDTSNNGDPSPSGQKIGFKIASRMEEIEENISYVWCYNNTWVNLNLSEHFGRFIDGVRIGLINDTPKLALINEPQAEVSEINQQDVNSVMGKFRGAISVINDTSQSYSDIMQIWPPSFICDIAYEDGSSLSLMFSKEHQVLSVLNGTWELSQWEHHGINVLIFNYSYDDLVFLPISNMDIMLEAIQSFENLIYGTFPS